MNELCLLPSSPLSLSLSLFIRLPPLLLLRDEEEEEEEEEDDDEEKNLPPLPLLILAFVTTPL